jgi:hypothetical protein
MDKLIVRGTEINVQWDLKRDDFLSLTDIAKIKDNDNPRYIIQNWLRNRNTIEFLGVWETLYNPNFNRVEFDAFRSQAGLNSFVMTPQKWVDATGAIGIVSKAGRYGGTYAHKEIAFEFASWISVEFKLYLHLLGTMNSIGMINAAGYHSAAVTLMRSIEDALDCLFAVVQSDINANKWLNGELKASQAARSWTADKVVDQSIPLGDYRKNIRHGLNKYSHCSPNQTSWNIYRKSDEKGMCRLELNYQHAVISKNGYYIDRYLCIHLYELMDSLPLYYSEYFADKEERRKLFEKLKYDIETIIKDFLNSIGSDKLYMDTPPELEGLSNRK